MANMSYCAFENTVQALNQLHTMVCDKIEEDPGFSFEDLVKTRSSDYEERAVVSIVGTMLDLLSLLKEIGCPDLEELDLD